MTDKSGKGYFHWRGVTDAKKGLPYRWPKGSDCWPNWARSAYASGYYS